MSAGKPDIQPHESSAGHIFAASGWLDAHFEAARPEYEAMVQAAGFRPGWLVLDAGCGNGGFLPLLAALVGPSGALAALDLAPENIAAVRDRVPAWELPCPVEARVGSVTALPYADDAFDAVWCANTAQYLTDDELAMALGEFRRVVRPGGVVAIKDIDGSLMRAPSHEPGLIPHLREARARAGAVQAWGAMRGPDLGVWMRRAGYRDVRLRTTLVERWPPYRPAERQYLRTLFGTFAGMAEEVDIPQREREEWARLRDAGDALFDDPEHYYREGHVLVVGEVAG
jgi:SAM-dependent methyltransferase